MSRSVPRPWVDVAKMFFALCVFLLHAGVTKLLPLSDLIGDCVVSVAVPYFFVASGFFLAQKVRAAQQRADGRRVILAYCRRLALKLLIFEPVSIVMWTVKRLLDGMETMDVILSAVQDALFYPRGALWYIQAVIVASLLLMPVLLRGAEIRAIPPAIVLYLLALLGTRYRFLTEGTVIGEAYELYERVFLSIRNGLFVGFPFMLCGCLIARWSPRLLAAGMRTTMRLSAAAAAAFALLTLESVLVRSYPTHDCGLFLLYLLAVPALFALTVQLPDRGRDTLVLRNLSTAVYLVHAPLVMVIGLAIDSPWLVCAVSAMVMAATLIPVCCRRIQPLYGWLT